jgi:hypothetical protein
MAGEDEVGDRNDGRLTFAIRRKGGRDSVETREGRDRVSESVEKFDVDERARVDPRQVVREGKYRSDATSAIAYQWRM